MPKFALGDVVKGRFREDQWYLATVERDNGDGTYVVAWLDGDPSNRVKQAEELRCMRFDRELQCYQEASGPQPEREQEDMREALARQWQEAFRRRRGWFAPETSLTVAEPLPPEDTPAAASTRPRRRAFLTDTIEVVLRHAIQDGEARVRLPRHAKFRHIKKALGKRLVGEDILERVRLISSEGSKFEAFRDSEPIGDTRQVLVLGFALEACSRDGHEIGLSDSEVSQEEDAAVIAAAAAGAGADAHVYLTLKRASALQQELCEGFAEEGFQQKLRALLEAPCSRMELAQRRQELLLEVQGAVLPKYGFDGTQKGVFKMMAAMGPFVKEPEFAQMARRINELIGLDSPPETWAGLARASREYVVLSDKPLQSGLLVDTLRSQEAADSTSDQPPGQGKSVFSTDAAVAPLGEASVCTPVAPAGPEAWVQAALVKHRIGVDSNAALPAPSVVAPTAMVGAAAQVDMPHRSLGLAPANHAEAGTPAQLDVAAPPSGLGTSAPKGGPDSCGAREFELWEVGEPPPFQMFIAGSWDDYVTAAMRWEPQQSAFATEARIGSEGTECFQLLKNGSWEAAFYPDVPEASQLEDHAVLGPDARGHGLNWQIGKEDSDKARPGAKFAITVFLNVQGAVRRVSWKKVNRYK